MKDRELEDGVERLAARFVDENPFVGDRRDDVAVNEVIDESSGGPPIEISRHDASPISVLCEELLFKSFVIVRHLNPARRASAPHASWVQKKPHVIVLLIRWLATILMFNYLLHDEATVFQKSVIDTRLWTTTARLLPELWKPSECEFHRVLEDFGHFGSHAALAYAFSHSEEMRTIEARNQSGYEERVVNRLVPDETN